MSNRVVAIAAALLMSASASAAQTPNAFVMSGTQVCAPTKNETLKKREELVKVQTKISKLIGAVDALHQGIEYQQQVESLGKLQAGMAATFSAARITKAMSDAILHIAEPYAPHVKKAYDAADAAVSVYFALSNGNGAKASASGLSAVQSAGAAYDEYLKRQPGMVIRPAKMETPGVVSSAVKSADDLRRGDYAGALSNLSAGVAGALDTKATKSKSVAGAVSSAVAVVADTPGKTDDARFGDALNVLSELAKIVTDAEPQTGAVANKFSPARVLNHSAMGMKQLGNVKQGWADTAATIEIYNAIDTHSTGNQKNIQKQIDRKLEEISRLREKEYELQVAISQAASSAHDCRRPAAAQSAAAPRATQLPDVRSPYNTRSPYTWDRSAGRGRLQRAQQARDAAEVRRAVPVAQGSSSGPVYGIWDTPPQPASVPNPQRQPPSASQGYSGERRICSDPPCGVN